MDRATKMLLKNYFECVAALTTELAEALGGKLEDVDPPKVVKIEPVKETKAPAPVVEPAEPEESLSESDELLEIPTPSAFDLADPTYPRARLEAFLKSRGYIEDQYKMLIRSELVKKCREVVEQMKVVQPGVKRGRGRPRKDGMPNRSQQRIEEEAKPAAIAAQVDELDPETRATVGKLLNIEVNDPNFSQLVVAAASADTTKLSAIIDAARAVLVQPLIGDEVDEVIEAAEAQIQAEKVEAKAEEDDEEEAVVEPLPVAIPAEVVIQKSMPPAQRQPNQDAAALPASGLVNQVLTTAAAKFGYKGRLLGYIANADLRTAGELLSTKLQQAANGEFGEAPAEMVTSYLKGMAPQGMESCGGSCLKCPRGGGQLAICATLLDREVMHGGLELVRDGKIRILMQPTGVGLNDSTAGYAKYEDLFEFGG